MKWLLPPVLLAILAVAMVALARAWPEAALLPVPLNYWIGIPLVLAGLGLSVAGSRRFRRAGTNIHTFRRPDVLVEDGVFSFSRNPMYLGFAVALLGFAIKLNAPTNLALAALFVVVADLWYIRFEERMAAQTFGAAYDAYRRRTRRWI